MDIVNSDRNGHRLKEERLRLGLSQAKFAELMDKKPLAVLRYEKGERSLNVEDLQALHRAGVDIFYIVTGERQNTEQLPDDVKILLKLWGSVAVEQRPTLHKLILNFAQSFPEDKNT